MKRHCVHKVKCYVSYSIENIVERKRRIRELIRTDRLVETNKRVILDMCDVFRNIFNLEGNKLSHTDLVKHSIPNLVLEKAE
jgi:hypothetical protein